MVRGRSRLQALEFAPGFSIVTLKVWVLGVRVDVLGSAINSQ